MAREVNEQEFRLVDKVSQGLAGIGKSLNGLKANAIAFNQGLELVGKGFNVVVGAAKGIGDAVAGVADFEAAMRRVQVITQATSAEQVELQDAVRAAGAELGTSSDQAAAALQKMAAEGFSAREAIDNLGPALAFAKANARDAAASVDGLANALDAFGESPAKLGALADQLTATGIAAGTSTDALEKGLSLVGVSAEQAGVSLADTVSLLGALAERGLEAGRGGKVLTAALQDFNDPASKFTETLRNAGLQGVEFVDVLGRMSADSALAEKVLASLGDKPRAALKALLTDGGGALKELIDLQGKTAGASKDLADKLGGTFKDALAKVDAQITNLKNSLITPIFEPLAAGLATLSTRLSEFAASPEFDALIAKFTTFATEGAAKLATFIESVDFEAAGANALKFAEALGTVTAALATLADLGATEINNFGAAAAGTFLELEARSLEFQATTAETLSKFDASYVESAKKLREAAAFARKASEEAFGDLAKNVEGAGAAAAQAAPKIAAAAKAAGDAGKAAAIGQEPLNALGNALSDIGKKGEFAFKGIPPEAKKAAQAIGGTGQAAANAALSISALEERLKAVREQLNAAPRGSPEFARLAAEAADLEVKLGAARGEIDAAAEAALRLAGGSKAAADGLAAMGSASQSAGESAAGAAEGVEENADAARRAELASMAFSYSLGEVNGELITQKLNAQAAGLTLDNYAKTVNALNAQAQEQVENLRRELEQKQELLKVDDEREKALDRLQSKYPLLRREALEPLLEIDQKLIESSKAATKALRDRAAAADELALASARQATGGIGTNPRPAASEEAQAPAPSGGGSRSGAAGGITINVSGLVTQDAINEIARQVERRTRLGR